MLLVDELKLTSGALILVTLEIVRPATSPRFRKKFRSLETPWTAPSDVSTARAKRWIRPSEPAANDWTWARALPIHPWNFGNFIDSSIRRASVIAVPATLSNWTPNRLANDEIGASAFWRLVPIVAASGRIAPATS